MNNKYYQKYIKYKSKYTNLKNINQNGGNPNIEKEVEVEVDTPGGKRLALLPLYKINFDAQLFKRQLLAYELYPETSGPINDDSIYYSRIPSLYGYKFKVKEIIDPRHKSSDYILRRIS